MKWKKFNEEKPLCYKTGKWDGRKSDPTLFFDKDENLFVGICYEGTMDGFNFFDCYDENGYEITEEITHWTNIGKPNE